MIVIFPGWLLVVTGECGRGALGRGDRPAPRGARETDTASQLPPCQGGSSEQESRHKGN